MYCRNCGTNNNPNATVCSRCGASLQQRYQQYAPAPEYHPEEHVSTGGWIGRSFLMAIPIVNIIMLFVWAFGSSKRRSLQTWVRAQLVLVLIAVIVTVVVALIVVLLGGSLSDVFRRVRYY